MKLMLFKKDAIELCKMLPDNSVDLFCYDPPYGSVISNIVSSDLSVGHRKSYSRTLSPFILISNKKYRDYLIELLKVQASKLKETGNIAILATEKTFYEIWNDIPSSYHYENTIYWWKPSGGPHYKMIKFAKVSNNTWPTLILSKNHKKHYENAKEVPKYLEESMMKTVEGNRRKIVSNLWYVKVNRKHRYFTAKPVKLLQALIECYSPPGGLVVDCFCGSGSTGEACLLTGRRAILSDISDDAIDATKIRLLPYKVKEGGKNVRAS